MMLTSYDKKKIMTGFLKINQLVQKSEWGRIHTYSNTYTQQGNPINLRLLLLRREEFKNEPIKHLFKPFRLNICFLFQKVIFYFFLQFSREITLITYIYYTQAYYITLHMFAEPWSPFVHPSFSFILLISAVGPTMTDLLESMKPLVLLTVSSFPTFRLYDKHV